MKSAQGIEKQNLKDIRMFNGCMLVDDGGICV